MRPAEAPLEKIARTALVLPEDERLELAVRLLESVPESAPDLLQRGDVQEAMRGAEAIIKGQEQGLSMDEFRAQMKWLQSSFLRERAEYVELLCGAAGIG